MVCVFLIGRSEWRPRAGGQGRAGIQLLPVNASSRTLNSFTACFLAVDITVRMLTKCSAPVVDGKHPETFWRSSTILMSRSAWLLSKGTVKSVVKRNTSSWCGPKPSAVPSSRILTSVSIYLEWEALIRTLS